MVNIYLFCAGGMSTSILATKMKKTAELKGIEAEIKAFAVSQISKKLDNLDVALLGPQIRFRLPAAKKLCDEKGIPVAIIPSVDYGMMNGEKVLEFALKQITH
ncbi:PTS sugar transporter subunit IIB [Clostridium akagii]|uniref:PTS sugar transporter subunit IIB n=1 Tax=Clostridium akagii TaxID=91623 RepID=UPI000479A9C7|nr:PTS sugar transporter subunit IIB [Clostridium akagii]